MLRRPLRSKRWPSSGCSGGFFGAADDPESFLVFLRTMADGVQVDITPTRIRVYRP